MGDQETKDVKCINCNHHSPSGFICKLNGSDTLVKKYDDIKYCFVLSDHLKSLDRCIELVEKMNKIIK